VADGARPLNFPGMQIIPALAIGAILWLFWLTQPWDKLARIVTILVIFSVLYFIRARYLRKS
jgi:hypothetical protein